MPDLNWSKNAIASIGASGQTNFTDAREAEESTSSTNNTSNSNALSSGFIRASSRGGAAYGFRRSYYAFDFTGYTTGTITNLALHYTPTTTSTGTLSNRIAQFNGFGSGIASNYDDGQWWGDIEDPLTPYSAAFNSADNTTAADVSLNSTAISDAKADGYLKFVLMNATDYNNINIGVDVTNQTYWNQSSNKTFLRFTYVEAGYGNSVIGVPSTSIDFVNNVGTANIVSVIGVT